MEDAAANHNTEAWLPLCVEESESGLHAKSSSPMTSAVITYTQLTTVNTCAPGPLGQVKHVTDVISLGNHHHHHHQVAKECAHMKRLRPHSTPATLLWLEQNFEMAEGICIPRSQLYSFYVDFCELNSMQPVNAASFGKIIRQQFPHLTTRRLGTRGQSRYHYYGIAVRDTSQYYAISYSKKSVGYNGHEHKKETLKQMNPHSHRTKIGNILPDFSYFREQKMPPNMSVEKVSTFLVMYRTHCQRLIDAVMRASFDEVQSFLLHFWKGIPAHISSILTSNAVINMIGVCDSFVYKAISTVLFPSIHQPLPENLTHMVRQFARDLTHWLRLALDDVNLTLKELKIDLAKCFSRTLRRQTSLNQLCQATRMILHTPEVAFQMLQDWKSVDLDGISRQILYTVDGQQQNGVNLELITTLYREFESILEDQTPIEVCMEWLESLIERCVVQPSRKCRIQAIGLRRFARQFLLMWASFGSRVIRDMTLHSAPSFGSFHLLHLTFDDYVLFLVESIHWEERTQQLFANIPNDAPPTLGEQLLDDSVVDPTVGVAKLKLFNSLQQQQQQQQQQQGGGAENSLLPPTLSPSHHDVIIRHHSPSSSSSAHLAPPPSDVIRENSVEGPMSMDHQEGVEGAAEVVEEDEAVVMIDTGNEYGNEHYTSSAGYHFVSTDGRTGYAFDGHAPANCHTQLTNQHQASKKYSPSCHQYMGPSSMAVQGSPSGEGGEYLNFGQYGQPVSVVRREYHAPPPSADCYLYDDQSTASSPSYSSAPSGFYPAPLPVAVAVPVASDPSHQQQQQQRYVMDEDHASKEQLRHQHMLSMEVKQLQAEDIPQGAQGGPIAYDVTTLQGNANRS